MLRLRRVRWISRSQPLTEEEREERDTLLGEGFSAWSKRDFNNFLRGCEKYGREDLEHVALEVEGKTEEEVRFRAGSGQLMVWVWFGRGDKR